MKLHRQWEQLLNSIWTIILQIAGGRYHSTAMAIFPVLSPAIPALAALIIDLGLSTIKIFFQFSPALIFKLDGDFLISKMQVRDVNVLKPGVDD